MAKVSYTQARADHEYLWAICAADDMTGGYVDQEDLALLLANPTKAQARDCYVNQIYYWFHKGPCPGDVPGGIPWEDKRVRDMAYRYGEEHRMPDKYKDDDDE